MLTKLGLPAVAEKIPILSGRGSYSMLSHSWFRDFLYEPHAVTALALLLAILFLDRTLLDGRRLCAACLVGLGFAAIVVTDTFIGVVGLCYYFVVHVHDFLRDPLWRRPLLVSASITVAVVIAALALGVFPLEGRAMQLGAHATLKIAPLYLLVELGPLIVFGLLGLTLIVYRGETRGWRTLLCLFTLTLTVGFLLRMAAIEPNIVLRKSIKVLQIPLVAFVAVAMLRVVSAPRRSEWYVFSALVVLPGVTTIFTDILQYRGLIGSPATTYVTSDEFKMLGWIRENTPTDAVIQAVNPERIYGSGTDRLIVALAERRTYYSNDFMPRVYQVPPPMIEQRKALLGQLFAAKSGTELSRALAELPALYLYVDDEASGPLNAIRELELRGELVHLQRSGRFSLKRVERPTTASLAE